MEGLALPPAPRCLTLREFSPGLKAGAFLLLIEIANCPYIAARQQSFADDGNEDYNDRGPSRASIIRLASTTISSVRLFSKLEGLSANARVDPGAKIAALQPFPTGLTSIRYPLYSITVIACPISIRRDHSPNHMVTASSIDFARRPAIRCWTLAEMRDPMRTPLEAFL
jgi:hypothetical protein